VKLLLDTQALLALLSSDYPLSPGARAAMEQPGASVICSTVSVWEIAIKRSIGKLQAPDDVIERIDEAGARILTITPQHAHATGELPLHHRDPFDRLLIAQAQLEGCAIITGDSAFSAYDVPVVW
jgi:PIN domain nuclease of toxin-antitoxin system